MKNLLTLKTSYGRRCQPKAGTLFESVNGHLIRAIKAGRKFHCQIITVGHSNTIIYGGWNTEAEAIRWAREEAFSREPVPPLFRRIRATR